MAYYCEIAKLTGRPLAEWERRLDAELDRRHRLEKAADDDAERDRNWGRLAREAEEDDDKEDDDEREDEGGDGAVTKARRSSRTSAHDLGAKLLEHLSDNLDRMRDRRERTAKGETMSREASIAKIIKDFGGVVRVCKNIALGHDDCGLSEHDLSAAIASYAKAKHPDLSEARAFTKVVTEGEDGLAFRKALDVVKQAGFVSLMPTFVRQDDAENHSGSSGNSASEALAKLAEEQRARAPWMTVAQAFSHVYLDPKNRHLAEAERAENRPQVR